MPRLTWFLTLTLLCSPLCRPLIAEGVPSVALSAQHQKMCRVGVGDAMPELTLSNPKGEPTTIASQYGKQATVIALVGEEGWMTKQLVADLPRDVGAVYGARGVATVVVNIGANAGKAQAGGGLTMLADPTGDGFAKLGSSRLPRVYVLNAQGKIVWFDIEYSRSTRRELKQTLEALAGK